MGFQFKRKEPVRKGIRRLVAERLEAALCSLKRFRRAEAIHAVRKEIKKARAVLRLAHAHLPGKTYRRQTQTLRAAAKELAATRDAYVKGAALRKLRAQGNGHVRPRVLWQLRKTIEGDLASSKNRFSKRKVKIKQALLGVEKQLDHLRFSATGWKVVQAGIKDSYGRGRRAFAEASQDASPERLHEWRKRAKDLWYQLNLLCPINPEQLHKTVADLGKIGEYLGDDHDLFLLGKAIEEEGDHLEAETVEVTALKGLIDRRQQQWRRRALALGRKVYAEKPRAFCARLHRSWRAWRSGKG